MTQRRVDKYLVGMRVYCTYTSKIVVALLSYFFHVLKQHSRRFLDVVTRTFIQQEYLRIEN